MTAEEISAMEIEKQYLRSMMSALNAKIKQARECITEAGEQWEVFNKRYTDLDRKIAFATKVTTIHKKKPEPKMDARMAQELLNMLMLEVQGSENIKSIKEGEEIYGEETEDDFQFTEETLDEI